MIRDAAVSFLSEALMLSQLLYVAAQFNMGRTLIKNGAEY